MKLNRVYGTIEWGKSLDYYRRVLRGWLCKNVLVARANDEGRKWYIPFGGFGKSRSMAKLKTTSEMVEQVVMDWWR